MIKIIITGCSGFLGSNILNFLSYRNKYLIYEFNHKTLDLTDLQKLKYIFNYIKPDYIINCSYKGGRRFNNDSIKDFDDNCKMIENLIKCKQYYNKLFLFSSGAVFDRRFSINNKIELNRLDKSYIPIDFYGRAKFFNDLEAVKHNKIINLRLFNCFSNKFKLNNSFIPICINKILNNEDIVIWKDHKFDTFYIQDLIKVIEHFIQNSPEYYTELNCVYKKKFYLSQLATKIKKLTNSKSPIIIDEKSKIHYTGNGDRLEELGLDLDGLEKGLKETIKYFRNGN